MKIAQTWIAGLVGAAWLLSTAAAAQAPTRRDIAAPPQPTGAIVLKTPGVVAGPNPETWTISSSDNVPVVQNVSVPTLTPFLPPKGKGRPRVADWCDLDNETLSELRSTRSSRKSSR